MEEVSLIFFCFFLFLYGSSRYEFDAVSSDINWHVVGQHYVVLN